MKKIAALIIIVAVFVTALPVFADTVCGMSREEYKKKPLYNKITDPIRDFKYSEKDKIKPFPGDKVTIFQHTADGIKEGSAKARQMSARQ